MDYFHEHTEVICTNMIVFIEAAQRRLTDKLEELEKEVGIYHGETPLLVRMKEEQEKARQLLR